MLKSVSMLALVAVLFTGCANGRSDGPGPATTTLHAMPQVGPLTFFEEREEIKDGKTNIVRITKKESPELGQARLKVAELKSRKSGNGDQSSRFKYWWQSQAPQGGGVNTSDGGWVSPYQNPR